MLAVPHFHLAWLLAVAAALSVWRARTAAKAALLFCGALLLCCASLGLAATAATTAPAARESSHAAMHASSSFAIADFDSDRRPDLATAEIERSDSRFARYLIHLQFAARPGQSIRYGEFIGLTGAFGLPQISAIDVNGDHAMDLVVTAVGQPQPIAVLLNDGRGEFSLANPGDFPSTLANFHSQWRPANGHIRDVAVLVPARTPQADSSDATHSLISAHLAAPPISAQPALPLGWMRSVVRDRAPPPSS